MPHAYIGALTNLWSVKLKTYSTNVFVTHRRSTNQFNICKPRHRNPCIHHSNTNCNTVASQSCVGAVCNSPSSCTYSFVFLRAVAGSIRVPTTVNQNVTTQPKRRGRFVSARQMFRHNHTV